MLVCLANGAEVKRKAQLKRLQFDVVVKTFCDINALLVKKKETEVAARVGRPCVKYFNVLN